MSSVSETIVREFFELHGFLVRQQRKYIARTPREDEEIDFLVLNPQPVPPGAVLPPVLTSADLPLISRAVVAVKGWHTDTFSPSVLKGNEPDIFRFVEPAVFKQAARAFGDGGLLAKILVMPALPPGEEARARSLALLREKGVDAVIQFRTLLSDLIQRVEVNRNYQKSDLLQMLRILKNYDFFRDPQLELFKPGRKRAKPEASA